MHRNTEIWEKRHARLGEIEQRNTEQLGMALSAAFGDDAARIRKAASEWAERFNAVERRVWNALCVAKGWRKR